MDHLERRLNKKVYKTLNGPSFMSKEAQSAMFRSIISCFPSKSVLVLGDAIIDEYVYCKDGGFSLSSPRAKKLIYERKEVFRGGAGNVAENLLALGAQVSLVTLVGFDEEADQQYNHWDHPSLRFYAIDKVTRGSNVKTRYCVGDEKIFAVERLNREPISKGEEDEVIKLVKSKGEDYDMVIFQDQNHGFFSKTLIDRLREVITEKKKVLVNSQTYSDQSRYEDYTGFGTMFMNLREARLVDSKFNPDGDGRLLTETLDSDVCVTLGDKGAVLFKDEKRYHAPRLPITPVDTCGAGDAFLSAFAVSDYRNDPQTALSLANIWAGLSTLKMGTRPSKIEELIDRIKNLPEV